MKMIKYFYINKDRDEDGEAIRLRRVGGGCFGSSQDFVLEAFLF